jgi:hypothetical protein
LYAVLDGSLIRPGLAKSAMRSQDAGFEQAVQTLITPERCEEPSQLDLSRSKEEFSSP